MCLYPKKLYEFCDISSGVVYRTTKYVDADAPGFMRVITVACGKCFECVQERSREWSHRIVDECKYHSENCFLTLSYAPEHLPDGGSLCRRDLQLFLKRYRQVVPNKIRVFYCGEYGKKALRPHYHIIIFGYKPKDLIFWKYDKSGFPLYRSPELEKVWTYGFSTVGDVDLFSAKYCAKYMQKMQQIPKELCPPFIGMSTHPGIGYNAVDVKSLLSDRIYHDGKSVKVPRYYLKVLERNGVDLTEFKERRQLVGSLREKSFDLPSRRLKAKNFLKKHLK